MRTRIKPRLRFIELGEAEGGEIVEPVAEPTTETPEGGSGGNPAWDSLRTKLDPISFHNIEADLKEWDKQAQQRVQSVNEQFKPYKQFVDAGRTPDYIAQAVGLAEQLESNPEAIYNYLGDYLKQNGRLPSATEVQQAEAAGEIEDPAAAEQQPVEDPRLQQLLEQQEQFQQYIQNQQFEASVQQESARLDQELTSLRQAHPELTKDDEQEIIQRAASVLQRTGNAPSMEEAYQSYNALVTRVRSIPRPGDSAPRLIPTSGGVPAPTNPQSTLGSASRGDIQSLVASLIAQQNQQ